MTSRLLQFNTEVLTADEERFGKRLAMPLKEEPSLFARVKKEFYSDETLAAQLQSGNADALTVLFKRHSPLLFGIARRILSNDAEAEDTVQQIFLDVFRSIQQFDAERGTFKTWLLMFTYQRTFNSHRTQHANRFYDTDPLDSTHEPGIARDSIAENRMLVEQVLRGLQPRQRRTIELIYYEGLTAEEVAQRTGESVRVVRHNLYRSLDKLRKAFRNQAQEGERRRS
jgi:RNA polymerase sigma-70 factor, ECF subfamily